MSLVYVSYGMTGLPFLLIKGTRSLEDESETLQGSLEVVRAELRRIQEKYQKKQRGLNPKDKVLVKKLREDERKLSTR